MKTRHARLIRYAILLSRTDYETALPDLLDAPKLVRDTWATISARTAHRRVARWRAER